jgi:nucleoside-diphosphate-sugar epimerase
MRVLITGAAGFLGHHVALHLVARGKEVLGIDSINDNYDGDLKFGRMAMQGFLSDFAPSSAWDGTGRAATLSSIRCQNLRFLRVNMEGGLYIKALFAAERINQIYYFAAQDEVRYSLINPDAYNNNNIRGFLGALMASRATPVEHVVDVSSNSFNDPWSRPRMALFLFIEAMLEGRGITIFNQVEMNRDFSADVSLERYRVYNIGNGTQEQLTEISSALEAEPSAKKKKETLSIQSGDVYATGIDCRALEREPCYRPAALIRDGIRALSSCIDNYFFIKKLLKFIFFLLVWILISVLPAASLEMDLVWPGYMNQVTASELDSSLVVSTQVVTALGSSSELPLWIHANRWGVLDLVSPLGGFVIGAAGTHTTAPLLFLRELQFGYNIVGVLRATNEDPVLPELNTGVINATSGPFSLVAGVMPLEKGEQLGSLSSGAMVLSRNARPIPRVYFGMTDYINVPLTDGIFQLRGSMSHGWLEEDRYIKSPWLHEKDLYFRARDPFGWGLSIYRGLVQEVVWGGTNPDGSSRPSSLYDFWQVFQASPTGSQSIRDENPESTARDLSDNVGMWDMGVRLDRPRFSLLLHHQHFYEVGSGYKALIIGDSYNSFERVRDGLWGLVFRRFGYQFLNDFVYEYINTTYQGDRSGESMHTHHYFEHWIYRTGWTYQGRMIGTPLVTIDGEGGELDFVHTRIVGHHFGFQGYFSQDVVWRALHTYSRSFGTYRRNYPTNTGKDKLFREGLYQRSTMLEASLLRNAFGVPGLFASMGIAWEIGELRQDSMAVLLNIGWRRPIR